MTFKKARDAFEQLQALGLQEGDDKTELLAIGLQELARAVEAELKAIKSTASQLEGKVRRLG